MKRTVLVVDDDRTIVEFVSLALDDEGYAVATAANGREAIDAVLAAGPDVILLDISMPVMDGREFYRWLRGNGHAGIPVVIMTAASDTNRLCKELGAQGALPKPFELDNLFELVSGITDRQSTGGGL